MTGKHPANLCPNQQAGKKSCHNCGGSCGSTQANSADLVAEITKKVMEQLNIR
jgi:L-fuculose-phosphate aldolase